MNTILRDKYGGEYKATHYEAGYWSVFINGAWCCIPDSEVEDPRGYLARTLFWSKS